MHFAASRRAASNLNILLQTLACSIRFVGLCERERCEITDAAPRGFKTQYFPSKRQWTALSKSNTPFSIVLGLWGDPGAKTDQACASLDGFKSENGANVVIDAALPCTSPRHALRLQNPTKMLLASIRIREFWVSGLQEGKNGAEVLDMTWAGNGGAVLPRLISPAPRRVQHAASYRDRCYRRIPPRPTAYRRVQVFFFGINLELHVTNPCLHPPLFWWGYVHSNTRSALFKKLKRRVTAASAPRPP
ncbi:hypothetical protein B0H16DRAFT_1777658 [Mycena metata]|uniref:Uncharacterized protein n=1 Tax=Mycena metata TaxID=1033252 RepID=A0AAD7HUB0_9AGAR|nr:hypothetical protein B0H16DRAFT_1777658 [Mycena metata]